MSLVNIKGKDLDVGETQLVSQKRLQTAESIISDGTTTASLTLWEKDIAAAQRGKAFSFEQHFNLCFGPAGPNRNGAPKFVLDNDPLQTSQAAQTALEESECELFIIPPCSPDPNLIETFLIWGELSSLYVRYISSMEE
ncbi:hypothetical protein ACROYT_G015686 [Oculina patagonica]